MNAPIQLFKPYVAPPEVLMPQLEATLYSGHLAQGQRVVEFESALAKLVEARHVIATSSCTAALHLAMIGAGVASGDEVITTPMTAEPTNLSILHAGGLPVFADVDAGGNIDPASVNSLLTQRTKAIVVVHYAGVPVDMAPIMEVALERGLPVIEDCAHALGARYAGEHVGHFGEFGCFSFQAIKHLTTGDGGALVCHYSFQARDARLMRWFGIDREIPRDQVDVRVGGFKYDMNDVTATIGLVQAAHVTNVIKRHAENGAWFMDSLAGVKDLEMPPVRGEPSWWVFTVLSPRRDSLMKALREAGIGCGHLSRRNDLHTVFRGGKRGDLPGLDRFWREALHIPCGWWVTDADRERIAETIRGVLR